MRRGFVLFLAALVLVAAAVVALAPASLLGGILESSSNGKVTATAFEGTIWRGQAQLVAGDARVPLGWSLASWPLLTGEVRLDLAPNSAASRALRGELRATRDHLAATGVDITLPAAAIAALLPRGSGARPAWALAGDITVTTPSLDWTPASMRGDFSVDWRGAALLPTGMRPIVLGDVTAKLAGDGTRLAGPVSSRGGDLDVSGNVALAATGAATVSLLLTPRNADAELARALGAIGTVEGSGWRINWQGKAR